MDWIIGELIHSLTTLQSASIFEQGLFFVGLFSAIAFPVGLVIRRMTRKAKASVEAFDELQERLTTALKVSRKLADEVQQLKSETSKAFIQTYSREVGDLNEDRAADHAQAYLDRQSEALQIALRARMRSAIARSPEDGAAAFDEARRMALAALAFRPDDRKLMLLCDELGSASAVAAASGARVKMKPDENRDLRLADDEQTASDLKGLSDAYLRAVDSGHYFIALNLAEHGLMLTRRPPFSANSREHLIFRLNLANALNLNGRPQEALKELKSLRKEFPEAFGPESKEACRAKILLADVHRCLGDTSAAISELEDLLKIQAAEENGGRCSKAALATRHTMASCKIDYGDARAAFDETVELMKIRQDVFPEDTLGILRAQVLEAKCRRAFGGVNYASAVLPDLIDQFTKISGENHPETLSVKIILADCLVESGHAKQALTELEAILENITQARGKEHPETLWVQYLIASCKRRLGDPEAAHEILSGILPLANTVIGEGHPERLMMEGLQIECLKDLGNPCEASARFHPLKAQMQATQLHSEHRFFKGFQTLEARLTAEQDARREA